MNEPLLSADVKPEVVSSHEINAVKPPRRYRVILLNDDYTPMDFVVGILIRFFGHSVARAIEMMLQVHQSGRAECGVFPRDIAETKVSIVNEFSRMHNYPLLCIIEPE